MLNHKIKTVSAALVAAILFAPNVQAHTVTVTPKGRVTVSNTDATTTVAYSQRSGYARVKVTSRRNEVQIDGSTKVFEDTTVVQIRIKKCPAHSTHCVKRRVTNGSHLVWVLPAPVQEPTPSLQPTTTPSTDCNVAYGAKMCPPNDDGSIPEPTTLPVHPKPVLECTFPDGWIIPPITGYDYVSTGTVWCQVKHDDNDPVRVRAESPDTEPAKFVPTEYSDGYTKPCPKDSSCFKTTYTLAKPGMYAFKVTATTESGQQSVTEGRASVKNGYPDYPIGGGKG